MNKFIPHKTSKFTLVLALTLLFMSCNKADEKPVNHRKVKQAKMSTPFNVDLDITLAITMPDKTKGLSGTQSMNWGDKQAMLFFYPADELHRFWMPDTYFDLDLFYLDKDFKVLNVRRKLKHFPAKGPYHLIPVAEPYYARHVLEMKSSSDTAMKIKKGMVLKWTSKPSPQQIESSIRRGQ